MRVAAKRLLIAGIALWAGSAVAMSLWPADVAWHTKEERATVASLLDRAESETGPRIFLAGSSSVLFGYSAAEIEAATGLLTVNLGIRSGRPVLDEEIDKIVARLRPDDVLVVSDIRWIDGMGTPVPGACLDGADLASCSPRFRPMPELNFALRLVLDAVGVSSHHGERDDRGDMIFRASLAGRAPEAKSLPAALDPTAPEKAVRTIAAIRARGACPVLAIPPQLVREGDAAGWETLLAPLAREASSAMVDPTPFLLRERRFFSLDAEHLSADGRSHVTRQLIDSLREAAQACLARA
jgi:hypothetical protein